MILNYIKKKEKGLTEVDKVNQVIVLTKYTEEGVSYTENLQANVDRLEEEKVFVEAKLLKITNKLADLNALITDMS